MVMFSIVMPLYNKRHYVQEAILSVLNQTLQDFELIVIDDGSTDDSVKVVKQISDPRLILISQKNSGVSIARNSGIARAKGKYICFLDADDYWERSHLEDLNTLAESLPSAVLYGTAYYEIWNNIKVAPRLPKEITGIQYLYIRDFYGLWSKIPFIFTSSIMVERELLLKSGVLFPVNENQGEDQEVWFSLVERGDVAFCTTPSVAYRREVTSSLSAVKPKELLPCYRRLIGRVSDGTIPPQLRKGAQRLIAKHQLDVAWVNLLSGFSGAASKMLVARFSLRIPLYWAQCFLFLFIPNSLRLKSISALKNILRNKHRPI